MAMTELFADYEKITLFSKRQSTNCLLNSASMKIRHGFATIKHILFEIGSEWRCGKLEATKERMPRIRGRLLTLTIVRIESISIFSSRSG